MNHDITHCTGVNGDTVCEGCHRKMAHEDLQRMGNSGEIESGRVFMYLNAEECVEDSHSMLWEL
ncbi:MAG: hypothetical protein IKV77_12910 [Alistipes sp.]|nr:hypothetical protein [Bacteroidales bacterium]MBR5492530.1 hypothetical protein [Alistipes sp.]MBR5494007.1 hypothetical protein [Alistipes sp.]MBR5920069.1 hypothetical protein [Bacteroidales bacterium]